MYIRHRVILTPMPYQTVVLCEGDEILRGRMCRDKRMASADWRALARILGQQEVTVIIGVVE